MFSIKFELVNPLGSGVQRVWVLVGDAVVLEHGHVVVVPDRGSHSSIVRRSPEEPDVKVLAVTQASGNAASLDGLAPMTQTGFYVHAIRKRDGDRLLVGQQRGIRSAVDLNVLIGGCGIHSQQHDVGIVILIDVTDLHPEVIWVGDCNLGVFPLVHPLGAVPPHRGQVARSYEALSYEAYVLLIVDDVIHTIAVDVSNLGVDGIGGIHETCTLRIVVRDEHVLPVCEVAESVIVQCSDVVPHHADSEDVVVTVAVQITHCEVGRIALYRVLGGV